MIQGACKQDWLGITVAKPSSSSRRDAHFQRQQNMQRYKQLAAQHFQKRCIIFSAPPPQWGDWI